MMTDMHGGVSLRATNQSTTGAPSLAALMKEIGPKATGWHGLVVGLSRLPLGERRTALSQTLMGSLEAACTLPHGTLALPNRDVLCLVHDRAGIAMAPLSDLAAQLLEADGLSPGADYVRRFNLERELPQFIALVSGINTDKVARPPARPPVVRPAATSLAEIENQLMPKDIAKVEKMFFKANVENFLRNQPICRLASINELEHVCEEIYISIDYLIKFFAHEQINSDVWLFQYFTRTLDARTLYLMGPGNEGERKKIAYNLNLNVATLFTEDFLLYDKSVPPRVRQEQTIEIQAFDMVENAHEMPFVRGFLKARGYRLCVDGVDRDLLMLMDWEALDIDVVKLRWSPELAASGKAVQDKVLAIARAGRPEMVLCRCEDEAAVDWGAGLGITHFQGWYLDGLSKPRTSDDPRPRYKMRLRDMIY